ncbi:unnamed protein product [Thlaspi arvense]|uniref:FAD-binding domain-containing protein n=1 Tax=Thlaspi arvense TaxID=13288 RepID=A0AAU9SBG5_THLAR|nr:unnamed protein product [Thlaspi arvense]
MTTHRREDRQQPQQKMQRLEPENEIVIVGGGICGLATALALHRKGINSLVLEKSEILRASGAAIGILDNGWRALEQLGVADRLRQTAIPVQGAREIWLDKKAKEISAEWSGENRCLRRSDLVNALADALPPDAIRFGCQVVFVELHPSTSYPILHLQDGNTIMAKLVIGCDGARSAVSNFLNLKPTGVFGLLTTRGMTYYPIGHPFSHEFVQTYKNNVVVGRVPIGEKLVHWLITQQGSPKGENISKNPEYVKQLTLHAINSFPEEIIQMVECSDLESLSFARLRYRAPWELLTGNFRKGTVTVAGDAMHVMGHFLGQGGSAGLEDAIVLARCLSQKLSFIDPITDENGKVMHNIEAAIDQYLKERKMRVARLSTQSFLIGLLWQSSSMVVKFVIVILMVVLFNNIALHTKYDCGKL